MHVTFDAAHCRTDAGDPDPVLAGARAGDRVAFSQLVRREQPRVVTLLGRLLPDTRDVEEATQDTFLQAWRHLDRFRGDAELSTWLHRIATNQALMRLRRRRPGPEPLDDTGFQVPDRAAPLDEQVAARMSELGPLRDALRRLPASQRVIVVLRDVDGLANAEIAELLSLPMPTVKARLHRGRMALRRRLERDPSWRGDES